MIASTELGAGKTPIWMPDDRRAIALAIATANRVDPRAPRLVRIENTLRLEQLWVAEALWQSDGEGRGDLTALGEPEEMRFTEAGHLSDLPLPAFRHGRGAWEPDGPGR